MYCGNLFLFWIVACVTLLAEMSSDSWSRVSISWYLWTFSRPIRAWCCNFFLRKSTLNQIISFRKLPSDILVLVIFDSNFDLSFVSRYLTLLDKLFGVFRHCFCFLLLFSRYDKSFYTQLLSWGSSNVTQMVILKILFTKWALWHWWGERKDSQKKKERRPRKKYSKVQKATAGRAGSNSRKSMLFTPHKINFSKFRDNPRHVHLLSRETVKITFYLTLLKII